MTQLSNEDVYYRTSDLALCAALCVLGYRVEAIDKRNPSRALFLILRDKKLNILIQRYFSHQLQVEPVSYFNSLKELKTRIYHA